MKNSKNCQRFIDAKGLKILFALFMKGASSKKKTDEEREDEEHIISCITSLLQFLGGLPSFSTDPNNKSNNNNNNNNNNSTSSDHPREEADGNTMVRNLNLEVRRIIKKFREQGFEKTDRLMELFEKYKKRVDDFDRRVQSGQVQRVLAATTGNEEDVTEDDIYLEKLEAGYFVLQQICLILVFAACDDTIKQRVLVHLKQLGIDKTEIKKILTDFIKSIGEESSRPSSASPSSSASISTETSSMDIKGLKSRILEIAGHFE